MVEFEKIGDTFEEGFDKVKDFTKKNKVLTIAICAVGAFALFKLYQSKTTSEDTEYTATYAYVPTAYDGYPTMSESVSFDDVVAQMRTETQDINDDFRNETLSDITKIIEDVQDENSKMFESIIDSMNDYDEKLSTMSYLEEQRKKEAETTVKESEVIAQMKANSEAWHTASASERAKLEAENQRLGSSLGADFDSATGTWSQDGKSLYEVSVKNKTDSSTANLTNVGITETVVKESEVIAQMKANSESWHTASETERKRLEAENQRLGSSLGANFDSASGTWTNSNGSNLYTVSSNTLSKSSSSTSSKSSSSSSSKSSSSSSSKSSSSSSSSSSKSNSNKSGGTTLLKMMAVHSALATNK